MKILLKIVLAIVVTFIIIAAGGVFYLSRGLDSGSKLQVEDVNFSALNDGTYNGRYEAGRWTNELNVTVKNHKITKVDVVKDVTFPKPEWRDQLFNKVIEQQRTNVDIVSGATVTSKAYLKSIENALKR
jgi:uncharacterized protein with FMN-binding domain